MKKIRKFFINLFGGYTEDFLEQYAAQVETQARCAQIDKVLQKMRDLNGSSAETWADEMYKFVWNEYKDSKIEQIKNEW